VDGTELRPRASVDAQNEWDQKSSEAFSALLMTMSDEQAEAVSGCKTAQDIWKKLAIMCKSTSCENKRALWQIFYSIMTKDSPVKTMCEIQNIAAPLRSLGVVVDHEAVVARVISSMMDASSGRLSDQFIRKRRHMLYCFQD